MTSAAEEPLVPAVTFSTTAELRAEIEVLMQRHPVLRETRYAIDCCHGCSWLDVWHDHGPIVADAWDRIYSIMWLIGDV